MDKPVVLSCAVLLLLIASCGSDASSSAPPPPPPPLPAAPSAPAPEPDTAEPDKAPAEAAEPGAGADAKQVREDLAAEDKAKSTTRDDKSTGDKAKGGSLYDLVKDGKATLPNTGSGSTTSKPTPVVTKPEPAKPEPAKPEPVRPTPTPPKPAGKVTVPSTDHVRVSVPSGLQADLNKDPRMQPWVKQVVSVADGCYTAELKKNANVEGVIEVRLTMHENERPDADIAKLPSQLSGIVACGTGKLMRIKMPLFTGKEGQKYTVKLHFEK